MPNCFSLALKTDPGTPIKLHDVDADLCAHFDQPVSDKYWLGDWYHVIGFLIAVKGCDLGTPALREEIAKWYGDDYPGPAEAKAVYLSQTLTILDYLESKYTSNFWIEIARR